MAPKPSEVWNLFVKGENKTAMCTICSLTVRHSGNTTNLNKHLKKHNLSCSLGSSPSTSRKSSKAQRPIKKEKSHTPKVPKTETTKVVRSLEGGRRINNCMLYFICKDNQAFEVIKGEGFQRLVKELAPTVKLPSVPVLKKEMELKYGVMAHQARERVEKADHLCITMDTWATETTGAAQSFLGVTVHFIEGVNIVSLNLATKPVWEGHTEENIRDQLEEILNTWGICKTKITGIVTDNGANIVRAVSLLAGGEITRLPCFAHTINLVVEPFTEMPFYTDAVEKVRTIVKYIEGTVVISDELRKQQLELGIAESKVKTVKLDDGGGTRWKSTFDMFTRYLELRLLINAIFLEDMASPEILAQAEVDTLMQIVGLLKPFEFLTRELSEQKYVQASMIIPMISCLRNELDRYMSDDGNIRSAQRIINEALDKRFGRIEKNMNLAIATILDPRFKTIHFTDKLACSSAQGKIVTLVKERQSSPPARECAVDEEGHIVEVEVEEEVYDFWKPHKELTYSTTQTRPNTSELNGYLTHPVSPLKSNPLEQWEEMRYLYPGLYRLARVYLCNMATSVPCERLLSKAGGIVCDNRKRLSSSCLDTMLFLGSCSEEQWELRN